MQLGLLNIQPLNKGLKLLNFSLDESSEDIRAASKAIDTENRKAFLSDIWALPWSLCFALMAEQPQGTLVHVSKSLQPDWMMEFMSFFGSKGSCAKVPPKLSSLHRLYW